MIEVLIAILTGLFTLGAVGIHALINFRNQLKTETQKQRRKAFAEIMGNKVQLLQFTVSANQAQIFGYRHERLWHIGRGGNDSFEFKEMQHWTRKSENLLEEVSRVRSQFFQSLGLAMSTFPQNEELDAMVNTIFNIGVPSIDPPHEGLTPDQLEIWQKKSIAALNKWVGDNYLKTIEQLLKYLWEHMNDKIK